MLILQPLMHLILFSLIELLIYIYIRMLHAALNKIWQQHTFKIELYGNIPKITITIIEHRMRFSGHFWLSREEIIREVLL